MKKKETQELVKKTLDNGIEVVPVIGYEAYSEKDIVRNNEIELI